jgi:hypothetical protein
MIQCILDRNEYLHDYLKAILGTVRIIEEEESKGRNGSLSPTEVKKKEHSLKFL